MSKFKRNDMVKILPIADDPSKNMSKSMAGRYSGKIGRVVAIDFSNSKKDYLYDIEIDGSIKVFAEYELKGDSNSLKEQEVFNKLAGKRKASEPKNNDDRTTCYWCNGKVKCVLGFTKTYNICEECGK